MMKQNMIRTAFALCTLFLLTSCDLTRDPKDRLSPETYFKSAEECRLFTNQFYTLLPSAGSIYAEEGDYIFGTGLSAEVMGTRTVPSTAGTWNWTMLRNINFYLTHSNQCTDASARARYDGVARFFRAWFYFQKVKYYGDVPWVDEPLDADDPSLYRGRDTRQVVMNHILEDIDYAIDNLPADVTVFAVNRWSALALKSRIFLFEGTFRKYHGIDGWEDCLTECANAGRMFLDIAPYTIYKEGTTPYMDLFNKMESDMTEVILSRSYAAAIGLTHDCNGKYLSASMGRPGLTKDIVNMYLMSDGSRFTDMANYDKMLFTDEVMDRDPRLAQTIRTPGYCRKGTTDQVAPDFNATTTGYHLIKYVAEPDYDSYNVSEQDMPVFRKAEVCLNYAEACAELGTLTQEDLDKSVNLLRDRVGMPAMDMADANATPDPYLQTAYPGVTGANQGVILEIRRERTVELMNEGFRYWDIMRWKLGKRFERPFYGMYFPGVGQYDLNGDGTFDLVIYDGSMPSGSTAVMKSLEELNLSEGTSGKVTVHADIERTWDETKDYLYPIPTEDRVLTQGKITQNPGWKDGLSF